jgi:2-C-methyl-D-erythritol 4-phosphate cytidylyltransferase
MKKFALIVAGGSGSRMGSQIPKQFHEMNKMPVLMHTIMRFYKYDKNCELIVVLPEKQIPYWTELCQTYSFKIQHQVVAGGATRFHSVQNGLNKISGDGIVFIHDGVRPLVSHETLERCELGAFSNGAAIPVQPMNESLRYFDGNINKAVNRDHYFSVQTPQTFQVQLIKEAYRQEYIPEFTDDASVIEKTGRPVSIVEGNRENIKITHPEDLPIAELLSGILNA